ncbi:M48 family metallopeptidase [Paracidobacterium acidisoli]|uniref:Peptidase M48 domain-containing protein n=1 Tax=Paracidobacterium acidisoli TaxID=2303751 RepID=A0A372IQZ0_9BACT|nr:M48 family metallopeptidase [Paracidobacterium acidisoli]MBT9331269.1 M48 family metalloprotease [Paracidobacterium acidisoli]
MRCLTAAVLLVLGMSAGAPAYARFAPPEPCKNAYNLDQEITLGRRARQQVMASMPIFPDASPVSQYVSRLGMRLTKYAPGDAWPWEFHVVDQAEINAFALPGGAIFVNLGTVQAAETEAQLAGVLAHEISHVVMRHSTCNITKQRRQSLWWGLAQIGAGVAVPGLGGAATQLGLGALQGQLGLKMSRGDERQADLMGVDILYDAGYDPRALPQFFEVIQGHYGPGGKQWLSDHPNPGNRSEYVSAEIATLPPKEHRIRTSDEFTAIEQQIKGIHAYTAKEIASGVWRKQPPPGIGAAAAGGFAPSAEWKMLHDTGYSLEHPENWQVYDGPGTGVTIAPAAGIAPGAGGDQAILCGVLVDVYQPQKGATLSAAAEQLLAHLQQQNAGLTPAGAGTEITASGRPARSMELKNPAAAAVAEQDWLVAMLRKDGSLEYIVFVAPEKDFDGVRPAFERILASFRIRE